MSASAQTEAARDQQPRVVRVSLGSAVALGLIGGEIDSMPSTAYLMTYRKSKCTANCGFCPQARESSGRADMLSRVSWPLFSVDQVLDATVGKVESGDIKRLCVQALNYPGVVSEIVALLEIILSSVAVPTSVSCQPLKSENLKRLLQAGVERIGIPLDAATERLFEQTKGGHVGGPYVWKDQLRLLSQAVRTFGDYRVSTHLIVGLGETEEEMVETIQECVDMKVVPAIFALTPVRGTALERKLQPPILRYRRIQLARYLIVKGLVQKDEISFGSSGLLTDFGVDHSTLIGIVESGEPFLTSGCPDCNRPYYNERPGGPLYNFPRKLTEHETSEILDDLKISQ